MRRAAQLGPRLPRRVGHAFGTAPCTRRSLATAAGSSTSALRRGAATAGAAAAAAVAIFALRERWWESDGSWEENTPVPRARLEQRYKLIKRIGQGGFGDVWLAKSSATGQEVAIKLMSLEQLPRGMIEQEVDAMRRCGRHRHVVELLEVVWVQPDAANPHGEVALVMELAGGGGLFERLVAEGAYTEKLASIILRQVALAIYHLHSRGIVHRDIKPENVVFDNEAADSSVKIIDFGTAIALEEEGGKVTGGGRIGTWSYWAPEQLAQQPYDFAVDMWSLGVLMYILLVGFHPFDPDGEAGEQQILANMKTGRVSYDMPEWQGVSPQAKQLVQSLLQPAPGERCTAAELVSHPWVLGEDVPSKPLPATQERLRAFIKARHAFYGSLLMGLLAHNLTKSAGADAIGAQGEIKEFDVMREGWQLFDRDGKGHIDASDLRRVCLEMGYKVSERDIENMIMVMSPTSYESDGAASRKSKGASLQRTDTPSGQEGGEGGGAVISFSRYEKTMQATFSKKFDRGQFVFRQGDKIDSFYVITRGTCEVRVTGPEGERVIQTLGAGDFFGETGLLEGRDVRAASVVCVEPLEVLAIDGQTFKEVAASDSGSKLSTSIQERAEARQRARLLKVFEMMSVSLRQRKAFQKGEVVYQQGQRADKFYIVNSGKLEMSITTPEGISVRVKHLKPGDHFGYDALLSEVHDATCTCLSDVELTVVPQEELRLTISKDEYLEKTVKAQRDRSRQQAAESQGHTEGVQLLPMMASAAASDGGQGKVEYDKYERWLTEMEQLTIKEGEAVFHQGDVPLSVYFVKSGRLQCEYRPSSKSSEGSGAEESGAPVRVVAKLGAGDHFGETAMLEERKSRNLSVRCISPSCELGSISISRFSEILKESSQLADQVQRAAEMRTNRRIKKILDAAAKEGDGGNLVTLQPGEVIFKQGDRSSSFYVVEEGQVEMSVSPVVADDDGEEMPAPTPIAVRRYAAGDCFGASGMLEGDNFRRNTATAITPVTLKVIPHKRFKVMLRDDSFLQVGLQASSVLRQKKERGIRGVTIASGLYDDQDDEIVQKALRR